MPEMRSSHERRRLRKLRLWERGSGAGWPCGCRKRRGGRNGWNERWPAGCGRFCPPERLWMGPTERCWMGAAERCGIWSAEWFWLRPAAERCRLWPPAGGRIRLEWSREPSGIWFTECRWIWPPEYRSLRPPERSRIWPAEWRIWPAEWRGLWPAGRTGALAGTAVWSEFWRRNAALRPAGLRSLWDRAGQKE